MTPEEIAAAKATSDKIAAAAAAADAGGDPKDVKDVKAGDPPPGETPEQKAAREKAATDKAAADAAAAKPKAPEKYELKIPEGATVVNARDLALVEKLAREADLDNATAQMLLDQQLEVATTMATEYLDTLKADKEYGGDKLIETQQLANATLNRVRPKGTPKRAALDQFISRGGVNNALEVVSLLADFGRMTLEDGTVIGSAAVAEKSTADTLYPNTPDYLKNL